MAMGISIDPRSYRGSHPDSEFQRLLSQLHGKVPTKVIEEKLKQFAIEKLQIRIHYKKVEDIAAVAKLYPSAHTIIGADGAHSLVRKQVFDDKKDIEKNLQYIIKVQYEVTQITEKLSPLNTAEAWSMVPFCVIEYLGKANENKTPIAWFVFVDKGTYDAVRQLDPHNNGVLSHLLHDTTDPRIKKLRETLTVWGTLRFNHKNDLVAANSIKIGAVELSAYKSEYAAMIKDERRYILIGDAKLGIPYYRSLNAGFSSCPDAVKLMSYPSTDRLACEEYNTKMHDFGRQEIERAYKNDAKAKIGKKIARLTHIASSLYGYDFLDPKAKHNLKVFVPLPFYARHEVRTIMRSVFWFMVFSCYFLYANPSNPSFDPAFIFAVMPELLFYSLSRTVALQGGYEIFSHMIARFVRHGRTQQDYFEFEKMRQSIREVGTRQSEALEPPKFFENPTNLYATAGNQEVDNMGLYEATEAFRKTMT